MTSISSMELRDCKDQCRLGREAASLVGPGVRSTMVAVAETLLGTIWRVSRARLRVNDFKPRKSVDALIL
jgi:hypothetical protein